LELGGIITAAITPLSKSRQIDADRLAYHCKVLFSEGCSYISTFGTTGEGASFSVTQKIETMTRLKTSGLDMGRFIPAIICSSFDDAGKLLSAYNALGCAGALVLPPFFYTDVSDDGIIAFFEAMSDAAGNPEIPLLLYNIPRYSGTRFTPTLVEKLLLRFGSRIVGIKDSTGDLENGLELVQRFPDLSIFTGDDRVMPTLVAAGGAGMIGGMPNIFARDLVKLYASIGDGTAKDLLAKAAQRIEIVDSSGGLTVLKAAAAQKYGDEAWLQVAPPLDQISEAVFDTFSSGLEVPRLKAEQEPAGFSASIEFAT
jgi:4-hydroxy-tetrahydrodipicolinate synthase